MGIEIIKAEIDLYILEKAFNEIEELYCKLDQLNDKYNECIDRLEGEGEIPY